MMTPMNGVEFGWGAPPMKEQHPVLPQGAAENFDLDNKAVIRCHMRGLITDSQRDAAFKKLTAKIGNEIRSAIAAVKEQGR